MLPATLQFLIVTIASAINDRLQRKLDYVEEERRILWEEVEALSGARRSRSPPTSDVVSPRQVSCSRLRNAGGAASSSSRRRFWRGFANWPRGNTTALRPDGAGLPNLKMFANSSLRWPWRTAAGVTPR